MSAAARAEARRKAILSRGTDRLAKLTTSARGDDAAGVFRGDTPPPGMPNTRSFLGEESSNMPTPRSFSASPSPTPQRQETSTTTSTTVPPSGPSPLRKSDSNSLDNDATSPWAPEQQAAFMAALRHASQAAQQEANAASASPASRTSQSAPASRNVSGSRPSNVFDDPPLPMDNPLMALLQGGPPGAEGFGGPGFDGQPPFPFAANAFQSPAPPKPPTRLQKLFPIIHLMAVWLLLGYFVLWVEPRLNGISTGDITAEWLGKRFWSRWASLGTQNPKTGIDFYVQLVPLFWAFTTLQLVLHSLRIFSGYDAVQPPSLLALALPHLPPPLPSVITNSLKYLQMGTLFLDDLSGLIVGIGFIIYFAGWMSPAPTQTVL